MSKSQSNWIDLRSDTVTRPSPAMRAAMQAADLGDDVYGDDPSVNRLQDYAADLFGYEAALFAPSGTQSNLLALLSHCFVSRRGQTGRPRSQTSRQHSLAGG